jgi:hypothetical protein
MRINLDLDDTERVVETVPSAGIPWETTGTSRDVTQWLGNATEADRSAIRLAAKQVSVQGQALRISFPSVMTFMLGFEAGRFRLCVPVMQEAEYVVCPGCQAGETRDRKAPCPGCGYDVTVSGPGAQMHITDIPGGRD